MTLKLWICRKMLCLLLHQIRSADRASGHRDDRPELAACRKALRPGDILVVWKLDLLGRDLRHLVNSVHDLGKRGIGFRVLCSQGSAIESISPQRRVQFRHIRGACGV